MPAKSAAQQKLFAIAEHHPEFLKKKNKRILGEMPKSKIREFAATKTKGLPKYVDNDD